MPPPPVAPRGRALEVLSKCSVYFADGMSQFPLEVALIYGTPSSPPFRPHIRTVANRPAALIVGRPFTKIAALRVPKMSKILLPPPRQCFMSNSNVDPQTGNDSLQQQGADDSLDSSRRQQMSTAVSNGGAKELAFLGPATGTNGFPPNLEMKREQQGSPQTAPPFQRITIKEEQLCGGQEAEAHGQLDQTDIYRELILRHLIADISGTCAKLGLPTELAAWTADDCRRWVAEMCNQFQLNVPPADAFANLDGRKMLALGVEDFQVRLPDGGDTLHAQLQLWKTAFESCGQFGGSNPVHPQLATQPSNCRQPNCYSSGYSPSRHSSQNNGASPPNGGGWVSGASGHLQNSHRLTIKLTPSPNEFGSSCSSTSHYSVLSGQQQFPQQQQQYLAGNGRHFGANCGGLAPGIHFSSQFGQSINAKLQCPPRPGLGPPSDCSATESVSSSAQQDDSSSVAEEDFMGAGGELSQQQHFFLSAAGHQQQQTLLEPGGGFCHFPAGNHFSSQIHPHQQGQPHIQQQQPQPQRAASHGTGGTIHLWHFIRELLDQPKEYGGCVRWVDRKEGTFKIESSHHLARYWGIRKNRMAMNYDKLSRSLRQYYKKGIIQKPEKKQRLVYKFLPPYNQ